MKKIAILLAIASCQLFQADAQHVGIGKAKPEFKLDVGHDELQVARFANEADGPLQVHFVSGDGWQALLFYQKDKFSSGLYTEANGDMYFSSTSTVRILSVSTVRANTLKLFSNAPTPINSSQPFDMAPPRTIPAINLVNAR